MLNKALAVVGEQIRPLDPCLKRYDGADMNVSFYAGMSRSWPKTRLPSPPRLRYEWDQRCSQAYRHPSTIRSQIR